MEERASEGPTGNGSAAGTLEAEETASEALAEVPDRTVPPSASVVPKRFSASVHPGPRGFVPPDFAALVQSLEGKIEMPLWLLVQDGSGQYGAIDEPVKAALFKARWGQLPTTPIALLIDSPGGNAKAAYQIATLLRGHCGGFTAVVPRYAKSAATLLTLGADRILLGRYAELGPLDAQILDPEREDYGSALDEVQALERLNASAMVAVDQAMMLLLSRTGKKVDTLLPDILRFVADMMRPLMEKIDTVHYTRMSRVLKVAEEYATRLLMPHYPEDQAASIARHLVERYPEHGFVIDAAEATRFGLRTDEPTPEQCRIMDLMVPFLGGMSAIGRLQEVDQG